MKMKKTTSDKETVSGGENAAEQKTVSGKKRKRILGGVLLLLLLAGVAAVGIYENNRVYHTCCAEAGVEVTVQDFLKKADEQAYFTDDSEAIDIACPGTYHVKIKTGLLTHNSILYITDSIAPEGKPVRVSLEIGRECEAEAFVSDITDATEVSVSYIRQPDFTRPGTQEVSVMLTDLGGNETEVDAELFVLQVVEELTVEAGSGPPALKDFVIEGERAEFLSRIASYDYAVPADHTVSLKVDGIVYEAVMHIVDTIPPKVTVQDLQTFTLLPRKAEDFIVSVEDVTEVTAAFIKEPDVTLPGEQTVDISVTDAGGNETVLSAGLLLEPDVEAPVIDGVADITVIAGSAVSYKKNVTVTDNCPEGLQLTIDNSAVNLGVEGAYPIIYTAKDYAGNETSVSATLTVLPKVYDEHEVYALADGVLAGIITPEMSPEDKLKAIYYYIQRHISYLNHSEKEGWVRAAYEGLVDGKGDCYVYACTAKVLLTRAGIVNMDIAKIPSRTQHYWSLVNLGDGWYHYDTTPRKSDHPIIIMWTDAQLMEYSARHYGSHNYDHTQYPAVN